MASGRRDGHSSRTDGRHLRPLHPRTTDSSLAFTLHDVLRKCRKVLVTNDLYVKRAQQGASFASAFITRCPTTPEECRSKDCALLFCRRVPGTGKRCAA